MYQKKLAVLVGYMIILKKEIDNEGCQTKRRFIQKS